MSGAGAKHIFNFCSGPAMLPEPVMKQAQQEFLNYKSTGVSVMELSHRSDHFLSILTSAKSRLRKLLTIPNEYAILFMQGGASAQFSNVPQNLSPQRSGVANYLNSGYWSEKAIAEAKHFCSVEVIGTTHQYGFTRGLERDEYRVNPKADYIHYTPNETIDGVAFNHIPETNGVPLVADMSSCILSEPIDVSKFGVIYAGAQKNIGPAGLCVVIIKKELLGKARAETARLSNYQVLEQEHSMANTPPTFAIYLANLVFGWLLDKGGIESIKKLNNQKAKLLYTALDQSEIFENRVKEPYRSHMNVPFNIRKPELEPLFLSKAKMNGLIHLEGHRSRGGFRASIYNAMPIEGVEKLVEFIKLFENKYV